MPRSLPSPWVLAGVGLVGGFFSALFGVGGGVVVVPLLVLAVGFEPKVATATSLAVIGFTAVFGAAAFGALGEVDWAKAAVVGFPAMLGTLAGTALHRRVSSRLLVFLFAAFLLLVALRLVTE